MTINDPGLVEEIEKKILNKNFTFLKYIEFYLLSSVTQ